MLQHDNWEASLFTWRESSFLVVCIYITKINREFMLWTKLKGSWLTECDLYLNVFKKKHVFRNFLVPCCSWLHRMRTVVEDITQEKMFHGRVAVVIDTGFWSSNSGEVLGLGPWMLKTLFSPFQSLGIANSQCLIQISCKLLFSLSFG